MNHFLNFRYAKVFAFALLVLPLILRGQSSNNRQWNNIAMPSPSTAAFGKYIDIPVSKHTGVPNINIPIHTITDGSISVPLSLSYHASGIRVNETASWVGLGWNINGVGQLSRTVMGLPDEKDRGYLKDYVLNQQKPTPLLSGAFPITTGPPDEAGEGIDYEPDIFSFSAGGYSGKFYIHPKDGVIMFPKQDVKIEYDKYIEQDEEFDYFAITLPNGDRFHFGKQSYNGGTFGNGEYESYIMPSSFVSDFQVNRTFNVRSTWYLVQIESQNFNDKINFYYEKEEYYASNRIPSSSTSVNVKGSAASNASPPSQDGNQTTSVPSKGSRLSKVENSSKTTVIYFETNNKREDIESINSLDVKRLDAIKIKLGDNDAYSKKIIFSYDYLKDNSCNWVYCKRLRLNQIQEISNDGTLNAQPYIFEYEGDNTFPSRMSKAIDHWGFYNGATNNNSLNLNTPVGGAIREPNEIFTKKGILKKISYPTGGNTEFVYELNKNQPFNSVPKNCGGLRIKNIIFNDGIKTNETEYDYSGDDIGSSSGVLISEPIY